MNDHLLLVILLITQWARVFTPGVCMIQFRWFFVHLWVPSLSLVFVASTWIKYHHTCTNDKVYIYIKMMSAWIIKRFPGAKKQQSTTSCTKTELEVVFRGARGNQQHASIQVTGMCDFLWSAPPKGPRGRWLFGNAGRALPSRTRHRWKVRPAPLFAKFAEYPAEQF